MKICKICNLNKTLEDYYQHWGVCKACSREKRREYYRNNLDAERAIRKKSREKNKEKIKNKFKDWYYKNPETAKDRRLRYFYKITLNDFTNMFLAQNGVCAICANPEDKNLVVDHDHITKNVRGLLCRTCNLGLGYFKDNPDLLNLAVNYLNINKKNVAA